MMHNWAEVMLKQVIITGNFAYLEEFMRTLSIGHELFLQVAQLVKRTSIPPNRMDNVKKFLMYLPITPLRHQLLHEMGFLSTLSVFEKELYSCIDGDTPNISLSAPTALSLLITSPQRTRSTNAPPGIRSDTLPPLNPLKDSHSFDLPGLFKMRSTGNMKKANTPNF